MNIANIANFANIANIVNIANNLSEWRAPDPRLFIYLFVSIAVHIGRIYWRLRGGEAELH